MKKLCNYVLFGLVLALAIALVLAIALGFSYLCYWLVLKAGAPNWVAVMFGIIVFLTAGFSANSKR
jgi:hypothetical protein